MKEELLKIIGNTPLDQLGDVFKALSDKVFAHRKENKGFVPLEIFPYCVGIGGVYPCVEIIIRVVVYNESGDKVLLYALKKRSEKEQGWTGQYQIIGAAGRTTDNPEDISARVFHEFPENLQDDEIFKGRKFIGIEIHNEPERQAVCWTAIWMVDISPEKALFFPDEWIVIKDPGDSRIIDHHRKTLAWASNPSRELFVDLR